MSPFRDTWAPNPLIVKLGRNLAEAWIQACSLSFLQDRIVKRAFLAAAGRPYVEEDNEIAYSSSNLFTGKEVPTAVVKILTKKPVVTSKDEAKANSRSRSAKLRVVEKL
jgi:16S rRNA C1402 N4-methylase RsmH